MTGHVREHCATPGTFMRRTGAIWVCGCGKVYKLRVHASWFDSFRQWDHVGEMGSIREAGDGHS